MEDIKEYLNRRREERWRKGTNGIFKYTIKPFVVVPTDTPTVFTPDTDSNYSDIIDQNSDGSAPSVPRSMVSSHQLNEPFQYRPSVHSSSSRQILIPAPAPTQQQQKNEKTEINSTILPQKRALEDNIDNFRVTSSRISVSSQTSRRTIILEHDTGLNTISVPIAIDSPNSSVASNTSTHTQERIRSPIQSVHGSPIQYFSPSAIHTQQTNVSYFDQPTIPTEEQSTARAPSTSPVHISSSSVKYIPTALEKSATDNNSPTTIKPTATATITVDQTKLDNASFEEETVLNNQPEINENKIDNPQVKEEHILNNVPIEEIIRQPTPVIQEDVEMDIIDDEEISVKSLTINDTNVPEVEKDTIMEEPDVSSIREKSATVEEESSSVARCEEHATIVENNREVESRERSPIKDNKEKSPVAERLGSIEQELPVEKYDGFAAMEDMDMYDPNDNNFNYYQDEEQADEQVEETADEYGIIQSELMARLNEMDFSYKPASKYFKMKKVSDLHIEALREVCYSVMHDAKHSTQDTLKHSVIRDFYTRIVDSLTSLCVSYQEYVDLTDSIRHMERQYKSLSAGELEIVFQSVSAEKKSEALKKNLKELEEETATRNDLEDYNALLRSIVQPPPPPTTSASPVPLSSPSASPVPVSSPSASPVPVSSPSALSVPVSSPSASPVPVSSPSPLPNSPARDH